MPIPVLASAASIGAKIAPTVATFLTGGVAGQATDEIIEEKFGQASPVFEARHPVKPVDEEANFSAESVVQDAVSLIPIKNDALRLAAAVGIVYFVWTQRGRIFK